MTALAWVLILGFGALIVVLNAVEKLLREIRDELRMANRALDRHPQMKFRPSEIWDRE